MTVCKFPFPLCNIQHKVFIAAFDIPKPFNVVSVVGKWLITLPTEQCPGAKVFQLIPILLN